MHERIKKLRKALDLTQSDFAARIGSTQNNIASYETGRRLPSAAALNNICKEFNVSEDWLRTGEGDMFVQAPSGILDALAQEYGLSRRGAIIIEKFLDLKPDVQEAIADYIEKVAASFAVNSAATLSAPITPVSTHILTDEEIKAKAAEYERELILEREAAAKSSASSGQKEA